MLVDQGVVLYQQLVVCILCSYVRLLLALIMINLLLEFFDQMHHLVIFLVLAIIGHVALLRLSLWFL